LPLERSLFPFSWQIKVLGEKLASKISFCVKKSDKNL